MRVLAIMCHPDDMELSCSGTLIKCKKRGDDVIACHAANGNMGHVEIEAPELREIRIAEAKRAAALGGFEVITADIDDLTMNSANVDQQLKLLRIIRWARPDFIITHHPDDYCSDHAELSKLVFKASFDASCPHFHPECGAATPVTPIFYSDTSRSVNFIPTEYVDITEEMELKEAMLACHESQLKWMRDHDHIDFADFVKTCAKYRGFQSNCAYAEAFRECLVYPKVQTKRLLP